MSALDYNSLHEPYQALPSASMAWYSNSLIPRPIQKIGEKDLVSTVCACAMRKAHVKLCKNVSNGGHYHVVMNYDVGMSALY